MALLASSATFDGIKQMVKEYFYEPKESDRFNFEPQSNTEWLIFCNNLGKYTNFFIRLNRGRYRFESRIM